MTSIVFLTPSSISDLTLFVFAALAAGYLWQLAFKTRRRASTPLTTIPLAGAFTGIAVYVLLTILEGVLYPDWGFYALPLRSVAIALAMVCLIQFGYRFPTLFPGRAREGKGSSSRILADPAVASLGALLRRL
jgi:hypothetical protein